MKPVTVERNINIPIGKLELPAILTIPEDVTGIIIFAHGSGSSRYSTRNTFVAQVLQETDELSSSDADNRWCFTLV